MSILPTPGTAQGVDDRVLATEDIGVVHYMRVVLREDQLDLIREIVREEIRAAMGGTKG